MLFCFVGFCPEVFGVFQSCEIFEHCQNFSEDFGNRAARSSSWKGFIEADLKETHPGMASSQKTIDILS